MANIFSRTRDWSRSVFDRVKTVSQHLASPSPHRQLAIAWLDHMRSNKGVDFPLLGLQHHRPQEMPLNFESVRLPAIREQSLPVISLVTPSYNQADMLERTIKSVLSQNYPRLQYVIQDGGSTDGSVKVIEKYASHLHHWESRPDGGQSQAIELGFRHTDGEIMGWLNSDDILMPGALWDIARFFQRRPSLDVAYGHRVIIDKQDRKIGQWVLPANTHCYLHYADYLAQESVYWTRRIWERAGGIDPSFRFAMDWDLFLRFRRSMGKFKRIHRFVGAFRIHESQKTSAQISEVGEQEMNLIRRRELGHVPEHSEISKRLVWLYWRNYMIERAVRGGFSRLQTQFV